MRAAWVSLAVVVLGCVGCGNSTEPRPVGGTWVFEAMVGTCPAPAGLLDAVPEPFTVLQNGSTISASFTDSAGNSVVLSGTYDGNIDATLTVDTGSRTIVFRMSGVARSRPDRFMVDGYLQGISDTVGLCDGLGMEYWATIPESAPQLAPPSAFTLPPAAVAQTSATLTGRVNPNGHPTTYFFEYGLTDFNQTTPVQDAGSGTTLFDVSADVGDLTPRTTYQYRIVAQGPDATTRGVIENFTTPDVLNHYHIESLISAGADFEALPGFGSTASVGTGLDAALLLDSDSAIDLDVPESFRGTSYLLEIQLNYLDGEAANFVLEDDQGTVIATGSIDNDGDDGHQTYTLLVDMSDFPDTAFVRLINPDLVPGTSNTNTSELLVNSYLGFFFIEAPNGSGMYVADIGGSSPRRVSADAGEDEWDEAVSIPDDFLTSGEVVFDISDVISTMSRPVIEISWGREEYEDGEIALYDDQGTLILAVDADYELFEDMAQGFLADLTAFRSSSFFSLSIDSDAYVHPFLKIQDAGASGQTSVMLDVGPGGSGVSSSGKFAFYETSDDYPDDGGMDDDNVDWQGPHWLADPTRPVFGEVGFLEFSLPPEVAGYENPVLEILHFSPDSEPPVSESVTGDPDDYPVEFFVLDDNGDEVAHIRFDTFSDDQGGVLKNQIPLGRFKMSSKLKILVPATSTEWSQMAFPPFLKIFDAQAP